MFGPDVHSPCKCLLRVHCAMRQGAQFAQVDTCRRLGLPWPALSPSRRRTAQRTGAGYTPIAEKSSSRMQVEALPHRTYATARKRWTSRIPTAFACSNSMRRGRGTLRLGHAEPNGVTAERRAGLAQKTPGTLVVTDFKTDNVACGLRSCEVTGPLKAGFIPQIYLPLRVCGRRPPSYGRPNPHIVPLQSSPVVFANRPIC